MNCNLATSKVLSIKGIYLIKNLKIYLNEKNHIVFCA